MDHSFSGGLSVATANPNFENVSGWLATRPNPSKDKDGAKTQTLSVKKQKRLVSSFRRLVVNEKSVLYTHHCVAVLHSGLLMDKGDEEAAFCFQKPDLFQVHVSPASPLLAKTPIVR